MGLFKKDKRTDLEKAIAASGASVNTGVTTEKAQKVDFKAKMAEAKKKDFISDKLIDLRNAALMRQTDKTADFVDDLADLSRQFRDNSQNSDNQAVLAIDAFLSEIIMQAKNYVSRGDIGGMFASSRIIKDLMLDRESSAPYYTNEKYYTNMMIYYKEYMNRENEAAKLEALRQETIKMIELAKAKPELANSLSVQILENKESIKRAKDYVDSLTARVSAAKKIAEQIKETCKVNVGGMQLGDLNMDDGLEAKAENAAERTRIDKFNEKMDERKGKVSSSGLTLNSDASESTDVDTSSTFDIDF